MGARRFKTPSAPHTCFSPIFGHNYHYLSNQRIAWTPPPASECVLKPSWRQVHGKAREARETGIRSLLGAVGTPGSVSALLSSVSPRLSEFPGWRARGLSGRRGEPGAGEEARRGAWCQGAGRPAVSSARTRPPLPPQARRGPRRSVGASAPAAVGSRRPGGALAAEQGRAQELPQLAEPLSSAARSRRSGARCRVWSGAAGRAVRTWTPPPAPGPQRREVGGAGRGGAGLRHLSASLRPRPLRLTCSQRHGTCTGPFAGGRENPEIPGT